jgi:hypothetical protein
MEQLVMRSLQIKNIESELWEGFYPVERKDGTVVYKPVELI